MADYSKMTQDQFDGIMKNIVAGMSAAEIIAVPGVYECLSEELNNDILDTWAEDNPELAYPEDCDEE